MKAEVLKDKALLFAKDAIKQWHYTKSIPSGKSYYVAFGAALVVWSIPANKNISRFLFKDSDFRVWELSRLWAPNNHEKNLLTQAISAAVGIIQELEKPDALVSYADPNAGHKGGVYRAASWAYHGQSEESRAYKSIKTGQVMARRAFHSGKKCLTKSQIEARGFEQLRLPGKYRFVKLLTRRAKRQIIK
jgi:hypothetical protein